MLLGAFNGSGKASTVSAGRRRKWEFCAAATAAAQNTYEADGVRHHVRANLQRGLPVTPLLHRDRRPTVRGAPALVSSLQRQSGRLLQRCD